MFSNNDVLETIAMVQEEHLDIRTITMGLSLLGCIRDSAEETARKVYDLVCIKAENIVKTASDLSREYGIPIVNKRVSVTPVSLLCAAFPKDAPLIAKAWMMRRNSWGLTSWAVTPLWCTSPRQAMKENLSRRFPKCWLRPNDFVRR